MTERTGGLAARYSFAALDEALLPYGQWRPFPTVADRAAWVAVRAGRRDRVVAAAEEAHRRPWPVLTATGYADYSRTGTRVHHERAHRERRGALIAATLAECLTGTGRYLDDVVDLAWMICEETSWSYPATSHPPRLGNGPAWDGQLPDHRHPVVDLFSAETGATLAWTCYLLGDALDREFPRVRDRIRDEVRRRLLTPYHTVDEWRWLRRRSDGRPPSNWNPWIHSNLLAATLAVEDDPYRRVALVARIVRGLDAFLDGYGADGGCEEGISYFWQAGGRLFDCLELLSTATAGKIEAFDLDKVREIGRFPQRMHLGDDWFVNVGDGAARQPRHGHLLHRLGTRVADPQIQAQGLAMRPATGEAAVDLALDGSEPVHRLLPALLETDFADAPAASPPLPRDAWLPDVEVLTCREREGTTGGLFLAAKGGHNDENHNHNDVGSFVVGLDAVPMLIDVGVGVYTRDTFSGGRYGIWTMTSAYHNVPLVDGLEQPPGRVHRARDVSCDIGAGATSLRLDLADAYPPESGLRRWHRTLRLERGAPGRIVLDDDYEFVRPPRHLALHLMSWPEPRVEDGAVVLPGQRSSLTIAFDADLVQASAERIAIDDPRLSASWGDAVHRIVLDVRRPADAGALRLLMTRSPETPHPAGGDDT